MAKIPRPTKAERTYRQEQRKQARARLHELGVVVKDLCDVDARAFSTRALDKSLESKQATIAAWVAEQLTGTTAGPTVRLCE